MKTNNPATNPATPKFKAGDTAYVIFLHVDGTEVKTCTVRMVHVYEVIPDFCKNGTRYAAALKKENAKPGYGLYYRPERLFATYNEAFESLTEQTTALIEDLKASLLKAAKEMLQRPI